jgi:hypothetical protein
MSSCGTTLKQNTPALPILVDTQPALENAQPALENVQPALENAQPALENAQPALENAQPVSVNAQPVAVNAQPVAVNAQPVLENTIQNILVPTLNPSVVPDKFIRYRHPSHRHRLFMLISFGHNYCNNKKCKIPIACNKTMFRCFRCDYDLCGNCFQLGTKGEPVPLANDDDDVDETTIVPITSWCVDPEY